MGGRRASQPGPWSKAAQSREAMAPSARQQAGDRPRPGRGGRVRPRPGAERGLWARSPRSAGGAPGAAHHQLRCRSPGLSPQGAGHTRGDARSASARKRFCSSPRFRRHCPGAAQGQCTCVARDRGTSRQPSALLGAEVRAPSPELLPMHLSALRLTRRAGRLVQLKGHGLRPRCRPRCGRCSPEASGREVGPPDA